MKTSISYFALFLFLSVCLSAVAESSSSDDRQIRTVKPFNAIMVSTGIDLYIEQGPVEKVEITGDPDDMNRIVTEVSDGTLHIYLKNKNLLDFDFHNSCEVYVMAKTIEALEASAGSEVKGKGPFAGNQFRVQSSSGSEVSLELEFDRIIAEASSGSEIHLKGKTKTLDLKVSSGSETDACDLSARIVHADASSGGQACVWVVSELHANASSGGDIDYKGNPATLDVNKSSGGKVSKE